MWINTIAFSHRILFVHIIPYNPLPLIYIILPYTTVGMYVVSTHIPREERVLEHVSNLFISWWSETLSQLHRLQALQAPSGVQV
jgi:hypothetical protein